MSFIKKPDGKFTTEDKIKMFQQMGTVGAVIAVVFVILIESGIAGDKTPLADDRGACRVAYRQYVF